MVFFKISIKIIKNDGQCILVSPTATLHGIRRDMAMSRLIDSDILAFWDKPIIIIWRE